MSFHTIAVPHDDIVRKKLTMDVFAADLWDTFKNRGSHEYTDEKTFFQKTHITNNLQRILDDVQNRLQGRGGDGFQYIETPFGGGKTHAMIAMYHSAKSWRAKPVVIVGTSMGPEDTIWGMIEEQLDGTTDKLAGKLAPGREKIRDVLARHGPVLILIDELLSYITTAAGVRIVDTTLATQVITFIQQLSEAVSTLDRVCVVASFTSSVYEMADKKTADQLLLKLRKVSGRKERKITPVDPDDIPNIIRSRLFSTPNNEIKKRAEEIVAKFTEYCEKESILPPKTTPVQYREKFEQTYPFLPQVIDTLYQNWGSFSSFQRTRGVLRLLSLVVYSLKDSERPYITLADFDLKDGEIRRELLDHIGDKFDSVISKDITDPASGAIRVEQNVGSAYRGLRLGTRAATAIFMYSFSSDGTKGATINQIKRAAASTDNPSSIVGDVVGGFKSKLSFFKTSEDRYLFSSEPNINRLKLDKMENIRESEVQEEEKKLLESNIGSSKLRAKIWPASRDVEDSPTLKLVIMSQDSDDARYDILENKGDAIPRIYRNSVFFLCSSDAERGEFTEHLKSRIALERILPDVKTNDQQRKEVEDDLQKEKSILKDLVKKCYRTLYVPSENGYDRYDMGIPTVGESGGITDRVLGRLAEEQQVHERIGPLVLKNQYLSRARFAHTGSMYEMMLKTRGSRRPLNRGVVEKSIIDGVADGMFGLGELVEGEPSCNSFKCSTSVSFAENEVIMHDSLARRPDESGQDDTQLAGDIKIESGDTAKPSGTEVPGEHTRIRDSLSLEFDIPEGRANDAWGIMRLVNEKFRFIRFSVVARNGTMTENDLERVRETLRQMGVDLDI